MSTIPLTITSVDKIHFQGSVASVNCPGVEGEMTILPNHMPLITTLKEGVVRVQKNAQEHIEEFPIDRGLLEVSKKEVIILL